MHERHYRCQNGDHWEVRWWSVPTSTGYNDIYQYKKNDEEVGRDIHRRDVIGRLLGHDEQGITRIPPE